MPAMVFDETICDPDFVPIASLRGLIIALPISALLWASIIVTLETIF
jgi:hypothetical protein